MPSSPVNVRDFEALARARMEPGAFDYYAGGAEDERTLAANERAFDRVWLRPRVLVDVSQIDTSCEVLGTRISMPILIAPTALHRLAHPEGECATARAAAAAGTLMAVSTVASVTLEEIAKAADGSLWFQLYIHSDRGLARELVERAEALGLRALVLTVDAPVLGRRERDMRHGFVIPPGVAPANFASRHRLAPAATGRAGTSLAAQMNPALDASMTWEIIAWLRSITKLPVVVKGVMTPEDARLAVEAGVSGLVVSNHGGRQLDGVEPTILALPRVVDAVAGAIPVLMDGGIRRGTDVLKALALGARAVLVGRAVLWGLAAEGERGVRAVLELLHIELETAMALAGRPTIASIDRSLVTID